MYTKYSSNENKFKVIELNNIIKICDKKDILSNQNIKDSISIISKILRQRLQSHQHQTTQKNKSITNNIIKYEDKSLREIEIKNTQNLSPKYTSFSKITQSHPSPCNLNQKINKKISLNVKNLYLKTPQRNKQPTIYSLNLHVEQHCQKINQEIKQTTLNLKLLRENVLSKIQNLQKKYDNLNAILQLMNQTKGQNIITKQSIRSLSQISQKSQTNKNINPIKQQIKKKEQQQQQEQQQQLVLDSYWSKYISITKNKIINNIDGHVYIFLKQQKYTNYTYTINLTSILQWIGIGFVDIKLKDKQNLNKQQYLMLYGSDGYVWDGRQQKWDQGLGFKQGQTITIQYNILEGTIKWRVDGLIRYRMECTILKNINIIWVPCLCMRDQGDCVTIINL